MNNSRKTGHDIIDVEDDVMHVHLSFFPTDPPPADGSFNNTAKAKLTQNGQLLRKYSIQFQINDGSARFQNAVSGSSGKTITAQTDSTGIASAQFGDTAAEHKTMTATVVKDPDGVDIKNGASDTETFTFTGTPNPPLSIDIFPLLDNAYSDNKSQNRVLIAVIGSDSQVDTTFFGPVTFTITEGSASFVGLPLGQPLTVNATRGFADASFVSDAGGGVAVTAALSNSSVSSPSQGFAFNAGPNLIIWEDSPYGSKVNEDLTAICKIRDILGYGVKMYLGLTAKSASYFVKDKLDPSLTFVNAKVCKAANITKPPISVVVNCPVAENDIELTANVTSITVLSKIANVTFHE